MKTMKRISNRRDGTAIVTTMIIMLSVCAFLGTMLSASLHSSKMAMRLGDRTRAQAIAEAGVGHAYSILLTNWNARDTDDCFPETAFGGGAYDCLVTPVGSTVAVITSTGTYNNVQEIVILDVARNVSSSLIDPIGAYKYSIVAAGDVTWTGCGVFSSNGTIHANGSVKQAGCGELSADVRASVGVTLRGSSGFIDGDVYAPDGDGTTSKVLGDIYEEVVANVGIPDIDLTPYYNHALANGEVYSGTKQFTTSYAPNGGMLWVNGSLKVSSHADLTGCFIATGDIQISSSGAHTKVANYPAFMSRDGDIKITSQYDSEGLLYTHIGDIAITGGGSVSGGIISGGDFNKSGNSTVFNYVNSTPVAPGEDMGDGALGVTAWQR